jgi:hypothetical protein
MKHLKKFNESNSDDFIIKNIMSILEDDDYFDVDVEEIAIGSEEESDWDYSIKIQRVPGQKTIKNSEVISIFETIVQRLESEGLTAQVLLNGRHGIEMWKENYSDSEYAYVLTWVSLLIWH